MRSSRRLASAASLALPLALAGCSLFPTTRKLPVPKAPAVVQTVTPKELVGKLDDSWKALQTLSVQCEIHLRVVKSTQDLAKDYPNIPGFLLLRKPDSLRVLGQVPVLHTWMFDMVSDGKNFTLNIPPEKLAYKGADDAKGTSPNPMLNLRPEFFFDAIAVRGLEPDEFYSVMADSETIEDPSKKHLLITPEYVLSVMHPRSESHQFAPTRVITFHRDDLLPYQQDIYDSDGNLVTITLYSGYRDFGGVTYPSLIDIKRPIEGIEITLTPTKVSQNLTLPDDQFQLKLQPGTKVKSLD
ncbi:MAG TPA: hypothetical protein VL991_05275 [Terracidiphilus sp.]|nr:hypothetical protein [Terracidiphilus sp.]